MDQEKQQYAEDFGLVFAQYGQAPMFGRVFGALMVADPPEQTAEELASFLQASRGSISQATQKLIDLGFVERISKPGDRRYYYRTRPNAWEEMIHRELEATTRLRKLADRGLEVQNSPNPEARRDLEEMREYYAFRERELPTMLEHWKSERRSRER